MVSTYPPDRDGIASYTARLENALKVENITIRITANGRDWKRNSSTYIFSIIRNAITSKACIVHIQLSYFMFGNEYYSGLFPLLLMSLKLLGKRVVITLHDIVQKSTVNDDFLKNHTTSRFLGFKRWALYYYTRIVCSMADKVIIHSEIAQNVLNQDYAVPQEKIQVIPHGINQVSLIGNENRCRHKSSMDNDRKIVTYFGLVRHGKGLEDLVKAWKKVRNANAQLLIIGGKHPVLVDNCYENLVKLTKELQLESSIRFCGHVPDEVLHPYLAKSDVFVFPYNEWGDVIASSGALSIVAPYLKPIIATDVPAFVQLKNLGAAVIVKKGDIDSIASAIMEVLTNTQTRNTLVSKLSNWLPDLSWLNVAEKTVALYRDLL